MRYRVVAVECQCGARAIGQVDEKIGHLRDRLADMGWYVHRRKNFDLCPGCLDQNPSYRLVRCPGCGNEFSVPTR